MASGVPQRDIHSRMTWSRIDQIEAASKGLRDELRRELGLLYFRYPSKHICFRSEASMFERIVVSILKKRALGSMFLCSKENCRKESSNTNRPDSYISCADS
jgi:hypothetical protein